MRAALLAALVAIAGCDGELSVDFTLTTSPAVGPLKSLSLEVSGDEVFPATELPIDRFVDGRATLRYVPNAPVGARLRFIFHVVADSSFEIVREVTLVAGRNRVELVLDPNAPMPDLGGAPDLTMLECTQHAECPEALPICTNMACAPCTADDECMARDPSLKHCAADGTCRACEPNVGRCLSDATLSVCDPDGAKETETTCAANDCNACTGTCGALFCEGNDVMSCDAMGGKAKIKTCDWACRDGACLVMLPAHFDRGSFSIATQDLTVGAGTMVTIDTKTSGNAPTVKVGAATPTNWPNYSAGIDPANVVVVVRNLTVSAGGTLQAIGARNLIIAATGDVTIEGTLDASGRNGVGGPGVGSPPSMYSEGGRGGGGHATAGGAGGSGGTTMGQAGLPALNDVDLAGPFKAGVSGATSGYALLGAGGGAVQISALGTITIGATGAVLAGGGGGGGGSTGGNNWPGNGGGSGGSILLEAKTVNVLGVVAANGGAGGSIDVNGSPLNGADAQPSKVPAPAQPGAYCTGGKGGAGTTPPTAGGNGAQIGCGGGGAYGRILIRVFGALPDYSAATISPSGADAFKVGNVSTSP